MPDTEPIWRGTRDMTERPDSFEFNDGDQGETFTLRYGGGYAELFAAKPNRYDLVAELIGGPFATWKVTDISLKRAGGGEGILSLTLKTPANADGTEEDDGYEAEVDQSQLELPVEAHPDFHEGSAAYADNNLDSLVTLFTLDEAGLPTETVSEDIRDVDVPLGLVWQIMKQLPFTDRRTLYYRVPESHRSILDELTEYEYSGQTSYIVNPPIVRLRQRKVSIPTEDNLGKVYDTISGFSNAPSGWKYLLSGQRALKSGRGSPYDVEKIFTGARDWPERFYPPAGT